MVCLKNAELYKKIGQKLQEARKKAGLTQEQVADYLGVNKVQLSYYENGAREISIETLQQLADLYGYTLNYFLDDEKSTDPAVSFFIPWRGTGERRFRGYSTGKSIFNQP